MTRRWRWPTRWLPSSWPPPSPCHCGRDRKSTRLNSSHLGTSYAVFCLKKKKHPRVSHRPADAERHPSGNEQPGDADEQTEHDRRGESDDHAVGDDDRLHHAHSCSTASC